MKWSNYEWIDTCQWAHSNWQSITHTQYMSRHLWRVPSIPILTHVFVVFFSKVLFSHLYFLSFFLFVKIKNELSGRESSSDNSLSASSLARQFSSQPVPKEKIGNFQLKFEFIFVISIFCFFILLKSGLAKGNIDHKRRSTRVIASESAFGLLVTKADEHRSIWKYQLKNIIKILSKQ